MPVYIYLGPELGKKQKAVDTIKDKYPNAEVSVFYAGETPVTTIANTIQVKSLFTDSVIVIVKNAHVIRKKDEVDLLVSCIKTMDIDTTLILLSEETKLAAAALDKAVPPANRQVFYEMSERDKKEWIRSFFINEGHRIENDCIDTILELVENNTDALRKECSRLVLFLPKDKPVTAQVIEKWLSHNREESAFTLFARIAAGDISKSLESVAAMLAAKESTTGILGGLSWCFRKLNSYLALAEKGEANNSFELQKLGLSSPTNRDNYSAAARRYNSDDVQACLALTAQYELLLRSPVAVFENILMDRYILGIINIHSGKRF